MWQRLFNVISENNYTLFTKENYYIGETDDGAALKLHYFNKHSAFRNSFREVCSVHIYTKKNIKCLVIVQKCTQTSKPLPL